jgi:2-iminobutanoate/2-iminopropanoate deaminase
MEARETPSQPWRGGPYTTALHAGDWIIVSGQIGVDPATGELVDGGPVAQARQALKNLTGIFGDAGCGWEHVAKVTQFVAVEPTVMKEINDVYAEFAGEHEPARSTIGVAWLPLGAAYEVEAWIYKPENWPQA